MEQPPYQLAVATVRRSSKGAVVERVITRFQKEEHYNRFRKVLSDHTQLEFHTINIREAAPPEGDPERGKLWCPYCSAWRKFVPLDGYRACEICAVTSRDFYTKKYNFTLGLVGKDE